MKSLMTKVAAGALVGATLIAAASPAEAQWRGRHGGYHHYYRHGNRTALALGAGALGLAVGAALASPSYGYGGGYYNRPYGYYGYDYAPPPAYYYAPRRCWTERSWDGWGWRRYRVCD